MMNLSLTSQSLAVFSSESLPPLLPLPTRLLITLSSDIDATAVLRSALRLHNFAVAYLRDSVFINSDLKPE